MNPIKYNIEIISAPSILGLKPTGVEELGESLLASGLGNILRPVKPVLHLPTLNKLYTIERDKETCVLNPIAIKDFSLMLSDAITNTINNKHFAFILGGDCSILLGVMPALKVKGTFGLVFLDAHADFYEPEKSVTGEIADMDLAIITGRGPEILTNINNQKPYVEDKNVLHIGQRDWQETKKYNSQDIRETIIKCFDLSYIEKIGIDVTTTEVLQHMDQLEVDGFWIHFDTDVISDEINPAVDYRLPGGLTFEQVEHIINRLLLTGKIAGISISVFNPRLDRSNEISKAIVTSIGNAFKLNDNL